MDRRALDGESRSFIGEAVLSRASAGGHRLSCRVCGQAFDMRDLDAVLHHETPGHGPAPEDQNQRLARIDAHLAEVLRAAPPA